jgi:MIP family channel proteins
MLMLAFLSSYSSKLRSRHYLQKGPKMAEKGLHGSDLAANIGRNTVAEAVGTFFLVSVGTGVAIQAALHHAIAGSALDSLSVAFAFGFALTVLVNTFGHTSGAHFNPAVTFALALTGKFPWKPVVPYIGAQLAGASLASAGMLGIFGSTVQAQTRLGGTYPAAGVSILTAMSVEAAATFLLMIVIMSVATDDRADEGITGLSIGMALFVGFLFAGPLTGGALNPARALGPMIVTGDFTDSGTVILGPLIGATLAAFLYDRVLRNAAPPET